MLRRRNISTEANLARFKKRGGLFCNVYKGEKMAQQIPVHLKHKNTVTLENDHLLPTTFAELVTESDEKQFISKREKERFANKQDKLGYVPLDVAGGTMTGPLILSNDQITSSQQAATKKYVDDKIASLVGSAPEALDTIYELATAIGNNPNFAVTVANMSGNKLDKSVADVVPVPNKLLYLDSNGELNTNASTASKLKEAFTFSIAGDITMDPVYIDGSQNVKGNISLDHMSATDVEDIFNQA